MSEFAPITTQEEFDKAIKSRLAQKDREYEEKYKDYLSPDKVSELKKSYEDKLTADKDLLKAAEDKVKEHDKIVSELTDRAEKAEKSLLKNKIAYDNKLPLELASRLVGDSEEELKKDAESLASLVSPTGAPPLKSYETNYSKGGSAPSAETAAFQALLGQLKGTE